MRDYGKVHTRFWSSESARRLTDHGRLLALYLITSPHSTIAGVFSLPDGYICEDMQWTAQQVAEGFAELSREGFANRCEATKWVWVREHLKWNPPENPNQRKAAVKVAQSVPDKVTWKAEFLRTCGPLIGLPGNPSLTVVEPSRNQKQEQEQEQAEKPSASSSADKLPPCPHVSLIDLYGKHLPELSQPKPELWKGTKANHMRARWHWVLTASRRGGERYATTADEAVAFFDRFFGYVAKSDFLTGRKADWSCNLPWLMEEANFAKVIEGQYENKAVA